MPSDDATWTPTPEAIAALVELLPAMERPTTDRWHDSPPADDGTLFDSHLIPDPVEDQFVERAYEHDWVYSFDWPEWQDEAKRLSDDPSLLRDATIATLRKLITAHIRKERFCEGHLRSARHAGALTAILCRLRELGAPQ
jgi:hypothetical protein